MKPVPTFSNYHGAPSGNNAGNANGVNPSVFWCVAIAATIIIGGLTVHCIKQNKIIASHKAENEQLPGYQVMSAPKLIVKPKAKENERG